MYQYRLHAGQLVSCLAEEDLGFLLDTKLTTR